MTKVNKSKDGRIGPEPIEPKPETERIDKPAGVIPVDPKPLKRMNKAELIEVALNRSIDIEGKTKAQLIAELEK